MPHVKTKTTYLEMLAPSQLEVKAPRADAGVTRLAAPSVEDYRALNRGVGSAHYWVDRLVMPDAALREILADDRVDVFLLTLADQPAGYSELDRRSPDAVELAYFGLFPNAIGQGLGKFLLDWTLRAAWSHRPRRVWVHTCELDHPAALPNYVRAGFQVYDQVEVEQWIPDEGQADEARGAR